MLTIEWLDGDAEGCLDYLPDWTLVPGGQAVLVHAVAARAGSACFAKCVVSVMGDEIEFDYEAFSDFNRRSGMELGAMRIALSTGRPESVHWRNEGEDAFLEQKVDLIWEPGLDVDPSTGRKGNKTELPQMTAARLGQGDFRKELQHHFNGCCALTGISLDAILRASHIKPWCICTDAERLDSTNGLLLAAHVDALFDRYLISFDDDGRVLWGSSVSTEERDALALPQRLRAPLSTRQKGYLRHHREIFQGR